MKGLEAGWSGARRLDEADIGASGLVLDASHGRQLRSRREHRHADRLRLHQHHQRR